MASLSLMAFGACKNPPATSMKLPSLSEGGWKGEELAVFRSKDLKAFVKPDGPYEGLVVAFWATWCDPCLKEMGELSALSKSLPKVGVLSLLTDETDNETMLGNINGVFEKYAPSHPQGRIEPGQEKDILGAFNLSWEGALPKVFLITPKGSFELLAQTADSLEEEIEAHLQGR